VLLAKKGARTFEPMPGRPMVEYVVVPPNLVAKPDALAGWIRKAVAYSRSLPHKAKKTGPGAKAAAAAAAKTSVEPSATTTGPTPAPRPKPGVG
jgi:hypothetical protein